jgi:hypothetical protein
VPQETIVQGLAYINWTVLLSLALGSFALVALCGELTDATRGYLRFTAFCSGLLGLVTLAADLGLPDPAGLAIVPATDLDLPRRLALGGFAVGTLGYVLAVGRGGRRRAWALVAGAGGLAASALGAYGWAGGLTGGIPLIVQFGILATVTGGCLAAVILGHWYLVTPRLSTGPLVLATRLLSVAVAVQLALFVVWVSLGSGEVSAPFGVLTGRSGLLVWLRLVVGLAFPLVLSYMAMRTARTRSMESATGLLYIDLAAIASGTIVAAGLYYAFGLLV